MTISALIQNDKFRIFYYYYYDVSYLLINIFSNPLIYDSNSFSMQVSKYTLFKHNIINRYYDLDYISGRFILQDIVVAVAVEQEEKYTIFNLIENIHFLREIIQRHVPSECFFEKKKKIQFTRNSIFYIFKKVAI